MRRTPKDLAKAIRRRVSPKEIVEMALARGDYDFLARYGWGEPPKQVDFLLQRQEQLERKVIVELHPPASTEVPLLPNGTSDQV